jgi:hypothetical protein
LRRFIPASAAALPAKLLQSLQYGAAPGAVLRPSWYVTRFSGARGRGGIHEGEEEGG